MNILRSYLPTFVKKVDHRLLIQSPYIWSTQLHIVLFYSVTLLMLIIVSQLLKHGILDSKNIHLFDIGRLGMVAILSLILIGNWIYSQMSYRIELADVKLSFRQVIRYHFAYSITLLSLTLPFILTDQLNISSLILWSTGVKYLCVWTILSLIVFSFRFMGLRSSIAAIIILFVLSIIVLWVEAIVDNHSSKIFFINPILLWLLALIMFNAIKYQPFYPALKKSMQPKPTSYNKMYIYLRTPLQFLLNILGATLILMAFAKVPVLSLVVIVAVFITMPLILFGSTYVIKQWPKEE